MATSFNNMLLSPQFTFLIGEDRRPVSVHAQIMASLSEPLDRLINGPMREAQEKCTEIPDIDIDIFLPLVEFAYRGDYTMRPCPCDNTVAEKEDMEDLAFEERKCNADEEAVRAARHDREEGDGLDLAQRWRKRTYLPLAYSHPREKLALRFTACKGRSSERDYKPVLLAHAKLYCLADRYIIPALKDLALQKLHETLEASLAVGFLRNDGRIGGIVALASYVYSNENTLDRGSDGKLDALRQEVLEFIVIGIHHFDKNAEFERLLAEEGQFAVDVVRLLNKERRGKEKREKEVEWSDFGSDFGLFWSSGPSTPLGPPPLRRHV